MIPLNKKRLLIFGIGFALLVLCIFLAGKGYLMPLILLFPTYIYLLDINSTLAGLIACLQIPIYVYLITFSKSSNRKLLISIAILLVHLLSIWLAINLKTI